MSKARLCDNCKRNVQDKGNYFVDCTYYGYNRKTSVCNRYIARVDKPVRDKIDMLAWCN